jgi:hypothetical protein
MLISKPWSCVRRRPLRPESISTYVFRWIWRLIDFFVVVALLKYGLPNRVGRVFSEKMKNASTHHETAYVVFMKSKILARSQRPHARANDHDVMDERFRCTTVNLQSVRTLCIKFNESVYTLCTVYTHCVYREFDQFSAVWPCTRPVKIYHVRQKNRLVYRC